MPVVKIFRKIGATCLNCVHCKTDEKGNNYCDVYKNAIDFINIYCGGSDFQEVEDDK